MDSLASAKDVVHFLSSYFLSLMRCAIVSFAFTSKFLLFSHQLPSVVRRARALNATAASLSETQRQTEIALHSLEAIKLVN